MQTILIVIHHSLLWLAIAFYTLCAEFAKEVLVKAGCPEDCARTIHIILALVLGIIVMKELASELVRELGNSDTPRRQLS